MKLSTLALEVLPLLQLAIAHPHRLHHTHQQKRAKKDVVVIDTVTKIVYAEPTGPPDVIVFVNQFGIPLSTMTEGILDSPPKFWSTAYIVPAAPPAPTISAPAPAFSAPAPTTSTAPAAVIATHATTPVILLQPSVAASPAPIAEPSPSRVAAPGASVVSDSPAAVELAPVASSPPPPTSSASPASQSTEASGYGFVYSPYMADNSCKTQDQVYQDFAKIGTGYSLVRTYGTDCNQTATVLTAAKAHNLKLFAGIFDLGTLSDEVNLIAAAAGGDWSSIDTISIGNELVNSGTASPSAVVAAVGTARSLLKSAGYSGKVVTVDTLVAARANPSLCDASDYCAVNSHPFFDGGVTAKGSGDFLTTQIPTLRNVLANKNQEIVITETGWPWQGLPNGAAVPSIENQADALTSIKSTFSSNPSGVILFTTFNDLWKTNTAAQFQAEQYWGFLGNAPSG